MTDKSTTTRSPAKVRVGRLAVIVLCLFLVAGAVAWYYQLLPGSQPSPGENAIMVIAPYRYYALDDPPMEGWICPAMFKYFSKSPKNLYVKAEPIHHR